MNRRIIITASLALVIVFLMRWWMPTDRSVRSIPSLPDARFDYTLKDFRSEFFNSDGDLEWIIAAPLLTHDSTMKQAIIQSPTIDIDPQQQNWRATAQQAIIYRNEDEVEWVGDVVIEKALPSGLRVIKTQRLHHDRRQRTIIANEAVEMHEPNAKIRAGGLVVDLNTNTMEFLNRVQGEIFIGDRSVGDPPTARQQSN